MEKKENKGIIDSVISWFRNLTVKGLLSAIFIMLAILIIISFIRIIPGALSGASSSLTGALYSVFVPAENATMTADRKVVDSGEEFTISFKASETADGLFKISYPCNSEIDLNITSSNKTLACDISNYVTGKNNSISLKAFPANMSEISRLVITGEFEDNNTLRTSKIGVIRMTIRGNAGNIIATTTIKTTNNSTSNQNNYQTNYYTKSDLAVRILQTGTLDKNTNYFTPKTSLTSNDRVGIKFEVRNDGDIATGAWIFYASLPSQTAPLYKSNSQVSLSPGDKIEFTIGFDNLNVQYSNTASISIDPLDSVNESDETNNTASTVIINTGYLNGNYYNGQQQYYGVGNLDGVCYALPANTQTGQTMNWYVSPTGGTNNSYTYYWSGTDNLSSYSQNPSMTYYTSGYKTATVVISSNGQSVTRTCSTNVTGNNNNYNYNNNLTASCYASNSNPQTGQSIVWYPTVSGGTGSYTYFWTGTDSLSSNSQYPTMSYYSSGYKTANLTITSGGYSTTANCSINVGGNNYNYNNGNQDLSVRMLNVGTVNTWGQFTPASTIYRGQTAAIQVEVTNNGNNTSGLWNYTATLNPSFPSYTYQGTSQNSLNAGEKITLTITFGNAQVTGNNYFNITLDPNNLLSDTNRSNNVTTGNISVY